MPQSIIEVLCPCCKATLKIDRETGALLGHQEAKKDHQSLEDFMSKQKNRSSELDARFADAQQKAKQKKDLLEKKFNLGKETHKDANPDERPPGHGPIWD